MTKLSELPIDAVVVGLRVSNATNTKLGIVAAVYNWRNCDEISTENTGVTILWDDGRISETTLDFTKNITVVPA